MNPKPRSAFHIFKVPVAIAFYFPLAFSPSSTRRRMASARVGTSFFEAHLSTPASTFSGIRAVTAGSRPVAGRPRPLFLIFDIDGFMFYEYQKNKPRGRGQASAPALNQA